MARIYGRDFKKWELLKRAGDISQLAGARKYTLDSGRAKGVQAVDIKTGSGLSFTVLPDRGMDIAWADYKGMALSFISKTGITSSEYFDPAGSNFLRSFYAGLLTTCGLTYMGAACVDEGKALGLHGRASHIPAEDVCVTNDWSGDEFIMKVRGRIRESAVFGENITLDREIEAKLGESKIVIHDVVENGGFDPQPLMLLYHCNFGYPLIDSHTEITFPKGTVKARDSEAQKGIDQYNELEEPAHGYQEQVFYHDPVTGDDGSVTVKLVNRDIGGASLGIYLKYNKNQLPYLIQWKQMGEGDYVLGIEPGTWYPEGRSEARRRGELTFIQPGEKRSFDLEIGILEE